MARKHLLDFELRTCDLARSDAIRYHERLRERESREAVTNLMQERATDQQEVEWQFDALDVRPVDRWLRNSVREMDPSVTAGETREISDTYLDTEDWRIYRAGYALRIRRTKGKNKAEATMKLLASENGAPGLRSRREVSEPLDSAEPEALADASGPVGERVQALSGPKSLRPLFEVETRRSTYGLALDGSEVGEIALDETAIPLENGAEPVRLRRVEVEVEPEVLYRLEPFVERLRDECKLFPAAASKYESGLFAQGVAPPDPPEFGPTGVDETLSTGELAFQVLREQFGIFLAHEPGTRIGEDPEEAHDMRVATRRMRAAMKIFEKAVPARTQKFRAEFKWVAGFLGEVRDLDVQLEHLEGWISFAVPRDREPLEALRVILNEQREQQRKAMLRTLNSRRYARLVESFGEFLRRGPSSRTQASQQRPYWPPPRTWFVNRTARSASSEIRSRKSPPARSTTSSAKKASACATPWSSSRTSTADPAKDLIKSAQKAPGRSGRPSGCGGSQLLIFGS